MRVAYVQFAPELCNVAANVATLRRLAARFDEADLVVLPELANSGYNFPSRQAAAKCAESTRGGPFLEALLGIAASAGQHIVTGLCERDGQALYNAAVLLGPTGVLGTYRKLHLFVDEKDIFAPGNLGLPVFDLPGARVGLQVCFDWIFPEAWRVLALRGAEIICHPANLVIPGKCQAVLPAHAVCNRVFIVTANRIGSEDELTFTGESLICGPEGAVLARGPADTEDVQSVEIDPAAARDKRVTRRNDIFSDRRPEEYAALCATEPT